MELEIVEGSARNRFYRDGPVAVHLLLTPGRILLAFPAGNTGAALWVNAPIEFDGALRAIERADGMRGISARLIATDLTIEHALLGSLRGVRGHAPAEALAADVVKHALGVVLRRTMRDGHRIEVTLLKRGGAYVLEACTDEPPLTPIPSDALLRSGIVADRRDLEALAFLAYEEKLLAGSWRFLTYFGRDTLITLALLMDVASERLIEAGLGAVLARLGPNGEVAHEEAIGEWPLLSGEDPLDHRMVDDDFLLAPVLARYLGERGGPVDLARAALKNLEWVVARAKPYAESGAPRDLIGVRSQVGQWRDSLDGLGGGRFPYDVNAILVPAALRAVGRLVPGSSLAAEASRVLGAWRGAADHFRVELARDDAQASIDAYANEHGLERVALDGPVSFPALALDDDGAAIPILHADESFALLFDEPPRDVLIHAVERMLRPFPAGLATPIGLVTANPAYAQDPAMRARFTSAHYHGTVVWSWQQALFAIGLDRQRVEAPELRAARATIAATMEATRDYRTSELWSFKVERGRIELVPFGQGQSHADESNALQLWSAVQLAIR